ERPRPIQAVGEDTPGRLIDRAVGEQAALHAGYFQLGRGDPRPGGGVHEEVDAALLADADHLGAVGQVKDLRRVGDVGVLAGGRIGGDGGPYVPGQELVAPQYGAGLRVQGQHGVAGAGVARPARRPAVVVARADVEPVGRTVIRGRTPHAGPRPARGLLL